MTLRSFLTVGIADGSDIPELLKVKIQESGGVIERMDLQTAPRGSREILFTLLALQGEALHRILQTLEGIPGVAVRSVSRHARPG